MQSSIKRLATYCDLLRKLKDSTPKKQRSFLNEAHEDVIVCVCELCVNLLNGNIKVTEDTYTKLHRFKNELRALARPPSSVSCCAGSKSADLNRRVAVQTGGGGGGGKGRQRGGGSGGALSLRERKRNKALKAYWKRKRQYLIQRGGGAFLTTVLSSALGGIVGKLIANSVTKRGT